MWSFRPNRPGRPRRAVFRFLRGLDFLEQEWLNTGRISKQPMKTAPKADKYLKKPAKAKKLTKHKSLVPVVPINDLSPV